MAVIAKQIEEFVLNLEETMVNSPDLDNFLQQTDNLLLTKEERLRQLAIRLEVYIQLPIPEKWALLERIYKKALSLNEKDFVLYESKGITATTLLEADEEEPLKKLLFDEAESSFRAAYALENVNPRLLFHWGILYYSRDYAQAIEKFKQAIALEPDHIMANMYIGYSYFDTNQFEQALTYFNKVRKNSLRGHWEQVKREELIGCAYIETGQKEQGLQILNTKVLSEYKLGRYNQVNVECDLAHLTEMLRTYRKNQLDELANELEAIINSNNQIT